MSRNLELIRIHLNFLLNSMEREGALLRLPFLFWIVADATSRGGGRGSSCMLHDWGRSGTLQPEGSVRGANSRRGGRTHVPCVGVVAGFVVLHMFHV